MATSKDHFVNMMQTRVLFSCTGIGVMNRGIESFFRESFDGLQDMKGVQTRLIVGKAIEGKAGYPVSRLSRYSGAARMIGKLTGRSSYAIEQISSVPAIAREIRRFRPHVIFSSEANLFFQLRRFRSTIGVPYKLLFSNGGPCEGPFHWADFVHQVSPFYFDKSIRSGESALKHFMVPYGISVPDQPEHISNFDREVLRRQLGFPLDRKILLSVGWISSVHKRMDYTIREVASLPKSQRPFLVMLGNITEESNEVMVLAARILDADDYLIRSVPYEEVKNYYRASDCFVLSSLVEGFGRVYLEALLHNLPVIAHHHPVMQFVVGQAGVLTDLSVQGALSKILSDDAIYSLPVSGYDYVRRKFDWKVLSPQYASMFHHCASAAHPFVQPEMEFVT